MPSTMASVRNVKKASQPNKKKKEVIVNNSKVELEGIPVLYKVGSTGEIVKNIQESLNALGFYSGSVDGIFGSKTEESVEDFQQSKKILVDGIAGTGTLLELNKALKKSGFKEINFKLDSSSISEPSKKLRWIKCKADIFSGRGGYASLTLRSDAAEAYKNLHDDVKSLGGIITTAGGKRSLVQKTSPSRSKKSMHYVGLAFDLSLPTGMQDSKTDPFIITDLGDRKWEVWCRTEDESVPEVELNSITVSTVRGKTKMKSKNVKGRFFSFTELAENHGFKPIRGRRSFYRGGSYTGAEWWHFQFEKALTKRKSKFGIELARCYDLERCKKFPYWEESKNCIFGIDWF